MAETAALLADEVFPDVPLRQWVISFPFPLRYLFAAHPQAMGKVLGIVYRAISTHLIHKAGFSLKNGATGAVTLIQRFGSALNLNIHFHILFLDGVYVYRDNRPPRFRRVKAPDKSELEDLVQLISQRVGRSLERQPVTELHRKGGLHAENSVPRWHDPGGLRAGGFHCTISSPSTEAKGQPHPLPRRTRAEPSLARARHAS